MNALSTTVVRALGTVLVAGTVMVGIAGTASAAPVVKTDGPGETSTSIALSGSKNGELTDVTVSCIGGGYWDFKGNLDGSAVDMTATFAQGDPGVGEFPMDSSLDPGHGGVAITVDDQAYVTDGGGENNGTFTVDHGGRSGAFDVQTSTSDGKHPVHVRGTWICG